MDFDRDAVLPTFFNEAEEGLGEIEQSLLALDRCQREAEAAIAQVFRVVHTLKGNAQGLGFDSGMGRCAHALENVLAAVRAHSVPVTTPLVNALLGGHDALRSMLSVAVQGEQPQIAGYEDTMHALAEAAVGDFGPSQAEIPRGPQPGSRAEADGPADLWPPMSEPSLDSPPPKSLRVDLPTLDRIVTYTGELSIALSRLRATIGRRADSLDSFHEIDRLFDDLRDQTMRLRLVRLGPLFRQQVRSVRDLAAAHGKLARLVVEGEDVEVDAAVRDALRDPITHMIRNALDHALEEPDVRRRSGKDPVGTITLRAKHTAGFVVVEVSDDGGGFHRGRILERARAVGLVDDKAVLGDDDLLRLVLVPGFSTATTANDLSGRGVGMDVVARNVGALKGSVSIRSTEGQGSVVTLRVPLTLAIIEGFAVGGASETFVIPMESVRECVALRENSRLGRVGASVGVLSLRGEPLPYVRLRSLLGTAGAAPGAESVVVVEHEGGRAGLAVDELQGEMRAVVRPLAKGMQAADWVAGATFLGDGRVALILDVPAIVRAAAQKGLS